MGAMGGGACPLRASSRGCIPPAQLCPLGRSTEVRNLEVMLLHEASPHCVRPCWWRKLVRCFLPIFTDSFRFITDFFGLSCECITKCITKCNPPQMAPI